MTGRLTANRYGGRLTATRYGGGVSVLYGFTVTAGAQLTDETTGAILYDEATGVPVIV